MFVRPYTVYLSGGATFGTRDVSVVFNTNKVYVLNKGVSFTDLSPEDISYRNPKYFVTDLQEFNKTMKGALMRLTVSVIANISVGTTPAGHTRVSPGLNVVPGVSGDYVITG